MKKYEIRYHFDNGDYIVRLVEAEDAWDTESVLRDYTMDDRQIFPDSHGVFISVNMNKVTHTKIWIR